MEIEDEFGISIPDEAAERMLTVGDTVDFIINILERQKVPTGICSTARAFYRLRSGMMAQWDVQREQIRPDAQLSALIPEGKPRATWSDFARRQGLSQPAWTWRAVKRFPPQGTSIRDVILQSGWAEPNHDQVFQRVRSIIASQMRLNEDEVRLDSRYIDDLGI